MNQREQETQPSLNSEREIERQRFFDLIREMQASANVSPEEADELAREAVEVVRSSTKRDGTADATSL